MKEWFKARNVWGATILALSDEEAGRIAKAIWSYTMNGEIMQLSGAEKGILPMILMTLSQDEKRDSEISAKRSDAANAMHMQANACKSMQMQAIDSICSNKNQNKNKKEETEQESESFMDADDAQAIQSDHNRVLDAAEDAGFKMSNDVRAALIALYADNGLNKMLEALKSCVDHGAPKLAYLKAVLKGESKKKVVNAQKFTQRDYDEVQDEAYKRMIKEIVS